MTVAVSSFSEFYSSTRGGGTVPLFHKGPIILEIMRDLAAGVVTTRVAHGLGVWSHGRSAGAINWVLIPRLLVVKDLNIGSLGHHIRESVCITGRSNYVVVDPVIVPSARLAHQEGMIPESLLGQPRFGYLSVMFGSSCEEAYPMSFIVPCVDRLYRIWECFGRDHSIRLLIGDVLTDGPIDINEIVLDSVLKDRAQLTPIL